MRAALAGVASRALRTPRRHYGVAVSWGSNVTLSLGREAGEGDWTARAVDFTAVDHASAIAKLVGSPLSALDGPAPLLEVDPRRPAALVHQASFNRPALFSVPEEPPPVEVLDVSCGWGHSVLTLEHPHGVLVCGRPIDFQATMRSLNMGGKGPSAILQASRWVGATLFGDDLGAMRPLFSSPTSLAVQAVAGPGASTGVVTTEGGLLMAGGNTHGQCATGGAMQGEHTLLSLTPSAMPLLEQHDWQRQAGATGEAEHLALGFHHGALLDSAGCIWTWGKNGRGECGDGSVETRRAPVLVAAPHFSDHSTISAPEWAERDGKFVAVSCGFRHTAALREDGNVLVWGRLQSHETAKTSKRPDASDDSRFPRVAALPQGVHAVAMECGHAHTAIVGSDGWVYALGLRGAGLELDSTASTDETGSTDVWSTAEQVRHPMRLCTLDSLLEACGASALDPLDAVAQLACGASHTYIVSTCGKVARVGWKAVPEPVVPLCIPGVAVRRLALGLRHGMAVVEPVDSTSSLEEQRNVVVSLLEKHRALCDPSWKRFSLT
jgi:alpha-tubulin suppressor-like RCC1 family protein